MVSLTLIINIEYSSFDDAVNLVMSLGSDIFMGKLDIKQAFCLCPVCPEDWELLGYLCLDKFYVDTM